MSKYMYEYRNFNSYNRTWNNKGNRKYRKYRIHEL